VLRDSGLDWTVVRPPRLTDKPLSGSYRTAYGQNGRGGWQVSRADVTLVTYDTGQCMRARAAGLHVKKLSKPLGEEPE
jgi:hypothetical protein